VVTPKVLHFLSCTFVLETLSFLLVLPHILPPLDQLIGYMHVSFCTIGSIFPSSTKILEVEIRNCWIDVSNLTKSSRLGARFWKLLEILYKAYLACRSCNFVWPSSNPGPQFRVASWRPGLLLGRHLPVKAATK
jgi:hypothetical protein